VRILLVEDSGVSRKLAAAVLRDIGHTVVEAADGEAGWAIFGRGYFDAVVSDWMMPGMDGLELCRRVRSADTKKYVYFILLTGTMCAHEDYLSAMRAGADDYLVKPLDRELISIRLRVAERIASLTTQVRQLEGLIPVCSYCRRVRKDDDAYQHMEAYITEHSGVRFSHGICPECELKHFPEYAGKENRG